MFGKLVRGKGKMDGAKCDKKTCWVNQMAKIMNKSISISAYNNIKCGTLQKG